MIVIASRRTPFLGEWQRMACGEHRLAAIGDATGWHDVVQHHGRLPALLIIDFLCLGQCLMADADSTPGGQLHAWRTLTRGVPLILAGTTFSPTRELAALGAGVAACCDEAMADVDVKKVIGIVTNGGVWVSGTTLPALISRLQSGAAPRVEATGERLADRAVTTGTVVATTLAELTERQREVAELVAQGASNKDIARKLDITERTVKAHLTTIYERLNINDRLQLAVLLNRQ